MKSAVNFLSFTCFFLVGFVCVGCTPPTGSNPAPEPTLEKQQKKPASTAYGKALEATDRLKQQAQDYNDKLDALNDPFAK